MTEKRETKSEKIAKAEGETEKELPFCTTAPSAEQHRGEDDDEPCDDGRAGD